MYLQEYRNVSILSRGGGLTRTPPAVVDTNGLPVHVALTRARRTTIGMRIVLSSQADTLAASGKQSCTQIPGKQSVNSIAAPWTRATAATRL
jgi:hypothetical protein